MSVSVSILSLVEAGAEKLIPAAVHQHAAACQEAGEDAAPLWVFADLLREMGEDALEEAVRYMAKRGRRPRTRFRSSRDGPNGKSGNLWEWSLPVFGNKDPWMLPDHLCGMESRRSDHVAGDGPTWLSVVAWLAGRIAYVRSDLDTTQEPAMKEDA